PARKAWLKAILKGRERMTNQQMAKGASATFQPSSQRPPMGNLPTSKPLDSISTADYIAQFSADPDLLAAVEAIAATASGLSSTAMPASEYIQITLDGR